MHLNKCNGQHFLSKIYWQDKEWEPNLTHKRYFNALATNAFASDCIPLNLAILLLFDIIR